MKSLVTTVALVFATTTVLAEDPYNPFQESFDNMFYIENPIELLDNTSVGPPPPVPLDGGLVALLVAGGAAGYGRYKKKRNEN
jgi:hypothetical protein